jgi:hypothetical protein
MLIYSTNEKEHGEQVRNVLQQLQAYGLYSTAEKCRFGVSLVSFHGCVICYNGIAMASDRITTIEDWPTPETIRDMHMLFGFMSFYWRFIRKHAKVTTPIIHLLEQAENCRRLKQVKWERSRDAELVFWNFE